MKIVAVNGSPRKGKNTDQMLDSFLKGVREAEPEAEVEMIRVYDHLFTGCRSCFACQMERSRAELGCRIKDEITDLLKDTFHADGIVFASPIYYMNVSAQLRAFWERLMYPGHSPSRIPTAMIYTMNMTEELKEQYMAPVLSIISMYLESCFGEKPEEVFAFNTFQYNDREIYTEHFRRNVPAKWDNHQKQFPTDLQNAYEAGKRMVMRITAAKVESK